MGKVGSKKIKRFGKDDSHFGRWRKGEGHVGRMRALDEHFVQLSHISNTSTSLRSIHRGLLCLLKSLQESSEANERWIMFPKERAREGDLNECHLSSTQRCWKLFSPVECLTCNVQCWLCWCWCLKQSPLACHQHFFRLYDSIVNAVNIIYHLNNDIEFITLIIYEVYTQLWIRWERNRGLNGLRKPLAKKWGHQRNKEPRSTRS